jgi:predicted aldo/keto reductase-like oxidoreductase
MKPLGGGQLTQRADLCIRWIMAHDVDIIIPGMKSMEELQQNIQRGHEYVALSPAELKELEELSLPIGQEYCHRCGYCLPCSQGIHIFSQIDLYKTSTLTLEQKRSLYKQMKQRGAKTASDCAECGLCIEKCPFKLPIPEILGRASKLLEG